MSYKEYKVRVYDVGNKYWYNKEDRYHREDGPAIESTDGSKSWYLNGLIHREDGPALDYSSGYKAWYLKGKKYTEEEFNQKMNPTSCANKEVEIDGKTYILKEKG